MGLWVYFLETSKTCISWTCERISLWQDVKKNPVGGAQSIGDRQCSGDLTATQKPFSIKKRSHHKESKVTPKSKFKTFDKKPQLEIQDTSKFNFANESLLCRFFADSITTSGREPNLTAKKTKPFVLKPEKYGIARVEQGECELPNT